MKRKKTGGRQAGTPNKRTTELTERIKEVCGEDFDPVLGMARLAQDELNNLESDASVVEIIKRAAAGEDVALDLKVAIKAEAANRSFALAALAEVSQYVHAKRKAVEVSGTGGGSVVFEMVLPK